MEFKRYLSIAVLLSFLFVIRVFAGNSGYVTKDESGDVGIGTLSPDRPLEVSGTGDMYARVTSTDANSAGIELVETGAGAIDYRVETEGSWLYWKASGDDFSTTATVMASPPGTDAMLDSNTIDISELKLRFIRAINANNEGVGIGFSHTTDHSNVGAAIVHERVGSNSQGGLHFATKDVTSVDVDIDVRMTIDKDGNVGIGDVTPNALLDVAGEFRFDGVSGDGAGQALCVKADGDIGTCSDAVAGDGTCTCG